MAVRCLVWQADTATETALSSHDAPSSREGRRLESPAFQRVYPLSAIRGVFDLRACRLGDIRHERPTQTDTQVPPRRRRPPRQGSVTRSSHPSAPSRMRSSAVRPLPNSGRHLLEPAFVALRSVAFIPQVHRPSLGDAVHFVQCAPTLWTQRQPMDQREADADRIQTRGAHVHTL